MSEGKPFYLTQNEGLRSATPEDDLLHRTANDLVDDTSATETQYFGFCVPEKNIHGIGYLWHHSRLRTVSGGIYAWQGVKPHLVYSELVDVRTHMSDAALADDLMNFRLDNGYGVETLEPLKRYRMTYEDSARDSRVDLHYEGLIPPVMFGDGNHLEQPMHVTGDLVIRGEHHLVDCFAFRDRSWGKPRQETHQPFPPYSWIAATFSPDFIVNCGVFDQAENNAELNGQFVMPKDRTLAGGWLYRHSQLSRIVKADKRVIRTRDFLLPSEVILELADEHGREISIRGTMQAANCWPLGGNLNFVIAFMRWECEGKVAYGDCQEGMWTDYYNAYSSGCQ